MIGEKLSFPDSVDCGFRNGKRTSILEQRIK